MEMVGGAGDGQECGVPGGEGSCDVGDGGRVGVVVVGRCSAEREVPWLAVHP